MKSDDERLPGTFSRRGTYISKNQFSQEHGRHREDSSHRFSSFRNCPIVDLDGGLEFQQSRGSHESALIPSTSGPSISQITMSRVGTPKNNLNATPSKNKAEFGKVISSDEEEDPIDGEMVTRKRRKEKRNTMPEDRPGA